MMKRRNQANQWPDLKEKEEQYLFSLGYVMGV
jgi:hypothetical protein